MKKTVLTVILSVILSGLTAWGIVNAATPGNNNALSVSEAGGGSTRAVNLNMSDYPDFTFAAEHAVEAVVYVKVTVKAQQQAIPDDPFFRYFFGDGMPQQRDRVGSGSGVIIRSDGYIVTNNHVVADASKVEVTLNNNKTYEAKVIGTDSATDVALIKIEADNLPTIEFADSDKLRLGEWVLAIGSPLGEELRSTITAGIVSAKGRSMPSQSREFKIESFIQTDAAVNPGNSGGALVNKEGALVGINTAIVSTTGSYTGYSFAVPSNIVKKIVGDLIDFGSVKRAKLGISMINLDVIEQSEEVRKELGINLDDLKLSSLEGVYIGEVMKGGAADKAGIKKGDILVEIDGAKVKGSSAVQEKVNSYHPGDKAVVTVIRDGKKIEKEIVFTGSEDMKTGEQDVDGTTAFYGARLRDLTKEEMNAYRVKGGAVIESVGNGKLAQAGAQNGFVIQYVNDQQVRNVKDVVEIARKSKRAVYIEGFDANGKSGYFGFGKE